MRFPTPRSFGVTEHRVFKQARVLSRTRQSFQQPPGGRHDLQRRDSRNRARLSSEHPGQIANPRSITTNTGLDANQGVEAALADFDAQLTGSLNFTQIRRAAKQR